MAEAVFCGCYYKQIDHYIKERAKKYINQKKSAKSMDTFFDTNTIIEDTISCAESKT